MSSIKRVRNALLFSFGSLLLLWNVVGLSQTTVDYSHSVSEEAAPPTELPPSELPCRSLPGANETLVIVRTGSTELVNRFTVHLSTSLRCFPNYLIFSDLEEQFQGEHILDALTDVSQDIQDSNPDFELYRRLRKDGRNSLNASELAGSPDRYSVKTGKAENPGWKLDKWKFLPMAKKTLVEHPDMKWYVFMEADSFILWSTLLQYLATLDSTKAIYAGKQMLISGDIFAHGGSGFVVSQPALRTVVDYYTAHKSGIERFTNGDWAGDCVLGKTFTDSGVPFTNAWPAFQVDYPGLVEYSRADARSNGEKLRLWCGTPVSYHHMSAAMVEEMWNFEQDWIASNNAVTNATLRHKDIFSTIIMPQMMAPRTDWDNLSDNPEEGEFATAEECRARCVAKPECRQYSLDGERHVCHTNVDPRLGRAGEGVASGWIEERIRDFVESMEPCEEGGWPY